MRYLRKKAVFKIQIHCWFYINLRRYLLLSPTCLPLQIFIKRRYSLWQRLEWGRVLESLLIFGQTFLKMAIIYHPLLLYLPPWIQGVYSTPGTSLGGYPTSHGYQAFSCACFLFEHRVLTTRISAFSIHVFRQRKEENYYLLLTLKK